MTSKKISKAILFIDHIAFFHLSRFQHAFHNVLRDWHEELFLESNPNCWNLREQVVTACLYLY